jgi:phosphatidylglycerophosphatase C
MNIAIYDLDKTITRRPTFTHFLLFYALRRSPYRLAALPIWIAALVGYRVGLYGRKPLKQFGIAIFMGRTLCPNTLGRVASDFVNDIVMNDLQPGARQSIDGDRGKEHRLIIATAAPEFYAKEIGMRLGFDDVVATRHIVTPDGRISHHIDGANCYGQEKLNMVVEWLHSQQLERAKCTISVYSDHASDAPLLEWADKAFLINPSAKLQRLADQKNWQVRSFETTINGVEQ